MPKTCKHAMLHGKRGLAGVIKFKDLEMEWAPWKVSSGGPSVITDNRLRARQEGQSGEGDVPVEAEVGSYHCWNGAISQAMKKEQERAHS